jgi:hypothetical protein
MYSLKLTKLNSVAIDLIMGTQSAMHNNTWPSIYLLVDGDVMNLVTNSAVWSMYRQKVNGFVKFDLQQANVGGNILFQDAVTMSKIWVEIEHIVEQIMILLDTNDDS